MEELHQTTVQTSGWGEPLQMTAVCTCGWTGETIREPYLTPAQLPDPPTGQAIRELCAELGHSDPEQYGTYDEAVAQALRHRGFDPERAMADAIEEFDDALAEVLETAAEFRAAASTTRPSRYVDYAFTSRLDAATKALADARYERHVWRSVTPR